MRWHALLHLPRLRSFQKPSAEVRPIPLQDGTEQICAPSSDDIECWNGKSLGGYPIKYKGNQGCSLHLMVVLRVGVANDERHGMFASVWVQALAERVKMIA
jgi:hypothetical protein